MADQFCKVVAEAEQLVKSRQYQGARAKLNEARSLSSNLWSNDARARELGADVDFNLYLEKAQKSHASRRFSRRLNGGQAALEIRPDDKEALALRQQGSACDGQSRG